MFKTNAHDQRANARLGVQIWHLRADCDHCMSNCLLLTISAQMPDLHTQSGIRALIVSTWPECSQREHSSTSILKYALFWVFWTVFYKKIPNAHDQCANARLGVQIWHSRADRDHYMSNCQNAHDQRANARSAHLIWHSRTDRDHFPNVTISARMLYYIQNILNYDHQICIFISTIKIKYFCRKKLHGWA